jgi:hypothetical protein
LVSPVKSGLVNGNMLPRPPKQNIFLKMRTFVQQKIQDNFYVVHEQVFHKVQ